MSGKWRGFDHEEEEDGGGYWEDHVQYAREMIQLEGGGRHGSAIDLDLGRPPEDLLDVLALLAVSGPANASLRALAHLRPHAETVRFEDDHLRILAGQAAFGFRSLFNQPETIGIIRGLYPGEPYWRKVLEYSASGCIQAVLDEYLHFLDDHLGLSLRPVNEARKGVAGTLRLALTLRTTRSRFEEIKQDDGQLRLEPHRLRNHIALAYGEQKSYGNETPTRETDVRQAFNSPFGRTSTPKSGPMSWSRPRSDRKAWIFTPTATVSFTGICPPIPWTWSSARAGCTATKAMPFARTWRRHRVMKQY